MCRKKDWVERVEIYSERRGREKDWKERGELKRKIKKEERYREIWREREKSKGEKKEV